MPGAARRLERVLEVDVTLADPVARVVDVGDGGHPRAGLSGPEQRVERPFAGLTPLAGKASG